MIMEEQSCPRRQVCSTKEGENHSAAPEKFGAAFFLGALALDE
jgi:hypothetical protein